MLRRTRKASFGGEWTSEKQDEAAAVDNSVLYTWQMIFRQSNANVNRRVDWVRRRVLIERQTCSDTDLISPLYPLNGSIFSDPLRIIGFCCCTGFRVTRCQSLQKNGEWISNGRKGVGGFSVMVKKGDDVRMESEEGGRMRGLGIDGWWSTTNRNSTVWSPLWIQWEPY